MARNYDEERLLSLRQTTRLPKAQIAVLLVAYFTQPVACTVIYPFIAKLVAELDLINGDISKIGYYSGLFDALPLLSEAVAILYWTRLGETYGRKRVLLCGAVGVAFSLTCFGLSKSLLMLIASRALQGALNANPATIKTMLGEITEGDEAAMARVFSFIPIVWAAGSTLAPLVGGVLQHPAERFPRLFTDDLWREYPFLLPCLAAASVPTVAFFAILLYLRQKLPHVGAQEVKRAPSYGTLTSYTASSRSPSCSSTTTCADPHPTQPQKHGFHWTRLLVVTLINYGILVTLTASFYALISLFLAAPIATGGLGFEPAAIGIAMALMGLCHGTFQAFFFVHIHRRVDPRLLFKIVQSLCGALGPTLSTILFAISKEYDLLGGQLIYVVMVAFSVAGVVLSSLLPPREEASPRGTSD
ncbi:hypothetical protein EUX98_g5490 [Antrodiella citrinella]|uniref:Major facilitator superfamily (MFS) profile domain-containing protein n=1 Tax=Antrodiella citrinella TaxID=2447956 RepID=A0A4S4MU87_9APHY|nr:hypothetical protein EUX98_g5490 [Antrodiella citrinella]